MQTTQKGLLMVISGPSATGKGTICARLKEELPIQYSISATTRAPRGSDVHGKEYFFLSKEEFEAKIAAGGFLEWAKVYENYYGTPRDFVTETLDNGQDCILEIDVQGALKVKEAFPEAVLVFVLPPSLAELRNRIQNRATETAEQIEERMRWVIKEISEINRYDYVVVNDALDVAVEDIKALLRADKMRVARNLALKDKFIKEYEGSF